MLSVTPIKSSTVSSGYYLKQDGNYYMDDKGDKDLYTWFGKGAENLGLEGQATLADHQKTFFGELPDGTKIGMRDEQGNFTGRPGYDLTFSANKDISLIICCTDDNKLKNELLDLHTNAVKEALTYLEEKISARITNNGKTDYQITGNMVAALCLHFNSRADQPDIHTHALVANMTERKDGLWRALSTDMSRAKGTYELIRDNATLLGHIYQNHMEQGVQKLGFQTQQIHKHGMFKIVDFDDHMRDHFSARRKEIVSIVDEMSNGRDVPKKVYSKVTENSRPEKNTFNPKDFIQLSKHNMNEYLANSSSDYKSFDQMLKDIRYKQPKEIIVKDSTFEAVKKSVDDMSKFSHKLDEDKIINKTFKTHDGPLDFKETRLAVQKLKKEGYLNEKNGYLEATHSQETVRKFKESVNNVKDQISIVQEPRSAQTAQNQLDQLIKSKESSGQRVLVLSANKSAMHDQNQHARDMNTTIWQKLKAIGKKDRAMSIHQFINHADKDSSIKSRTTLIIDDAQRQSLAISQKILDIADRTGCEVVALEFNEGRRSQLAGNALETMKECGVAVEKVKSEVAKNTCQINIEERKPKDLINQTKQEELKAKLDGIVDIAMQKGLQNVDIVAANKTEAKILNQKIHAQNNMSIAHEITIHKRIYPNGNDKSIKPGMLIQERKNSHVQFTPIKRIDRNNQVVVIDHGGDREKRLAMSSVLNKQLYKAEKLELKDSEYVKLGSYNDNSKQLSLKDGIRYQISFLEKNKVLLTPENSRHKTVKTTVDKINHMDWQYDYAKTPEQVNKQVNQTKEAIVSAPAIGKISGLINDINRSYNKATIVTSDQKTYDRAHNKIEKDEQKLSLNRGEVTKTPAQQAVQYAIDSVSSRDSTFTLDELTEKALEYRVDCKTNDLVGAIYEQVKSGELRTKQFSNKEAIFATKEAFDHEKSIISLIQETKGQEAPYMQSSDIKFQLSNTNLTKGQRDACEMLATTTDKFNLVQGYAGTGKSTMLKTLVNSLESSNVIKPKDIIALGPTHKSVKELCDKGMKAQTLKRFLVDHDQLKQNTDNKLFIIDEMSMVGTHEFKEVMQIIADSHGSKCGLLGDNQQFLSVAYGAASTLSEISSEANINRAQMDEIKRQKTPYLKEAVAHLKNNDLGSLGQAFSVLEKNGCVHESMPLLQEGQDSKEALNISIMQCAQDYVDMPKEHRDETLVITPTNAIRNDLNDAIRELRIEKKEISGDALRIENYVDSQLTDAELRYTGNYKLNDTIKVFNDAGKVADIDHEKRSLLMQMKDGSSKVINLAQDKVIIEKYERREMYIQKGDQLKWTKTDYDRNVMSHSTLTVLEVDSKNNSMTALDENNKEVHVNFNLEQNKHIDYAYASTVYGSQGATSKYVLAVMNAHSKIANSLESMYVGVTRATDSFKLYTQQLSTLYQSIAQNQKHDQIALRAFNELKVKDEFINKASPAPVKTNLTYNQIHQKPSNWIEANDLLPRMNQSAELVCESVLGERNKRLSNSTHWRYGSKGSLSVTVNGSWAGRFNNFETSEKGNLLQLIQAERGCDFRTALEIGARAVGYISGSSQPLPSINRGHSQPKDKADINRTAADDLAKLRNKAINLEGTVGEKYLKSRGIDPKNTDNVFFIRNISTGGGNMDLMKYSSALLAIAKDAKGNIQSGQLTYLDKKTGDKLTNLQISKRSRGTFAGSYIELRKNISKPEIVFAAEGLETALSIKTALDKTGFDQAGVTTSFGVANLKQVAKDHDVKNIVLVLDNDGAGAGSEKAARQAISEMESRGKRVFTIQPEQLTNRHKTDYNDLLQAGKLDSIVKDVQDVMDKYKSSMTPTEHTQKQQAGPGNDHIQNKTMEIEKEIVG